MSSISMYDLIKEEIEKSNYTNKQIISMLGIAKGTYYDIFKKKQIGVQEFIRLSEILNYNPVDFLKTSIINS